MKMFALETRRGSIGGAQVVVGDVCGKGDWRPLARLGARLQRPLGVDGRQLDRKQVQCARGSHLFLPRHHQQ